MSLINYYNLPEEQVKPVLDKMLKEEVVSRIWQHNYTLWKESPAEITNRLGWLSSHEEMAGMIDEIYTFVDEIREAGFRQALLLGMGGSSMAPEFFRLVFGAKPGYPDLQVLDTTDPGAIQARAGQLNPAKTLFIVSTKSGGTVETVSLMKYFYNLTSGAEGVIKAGDNFMAITDPGSGMEKAAKDLGFRKIFLNDPEIGGRYSALSYFGLVPAALTGVDLKQLLADAEQAAESARKNEISASANSAAWLGALAGSCAAAGRDKLTLIFSPSLKAFGPWLEQLLAESTGKEGRGILPVDGETLAAPEIYAADRLFVRFKREDDDRDHEKVEALIQAGHPLVEIILENYYELGGELFRWMFATAVAGWVLNINPFDQPNVEAAKVQARRLINEYKEKGSLPLLQPDLENDEIDVYSGFKADNLKETWQTFFRHLESGSKEHGYIAIQAYLPPAPETDSTLQKLGSKLQQSYRVAVTTGYGPRFLHSTGQLHKGDAGKGLFIQLTTEHDQELPIPDEAGGNRSSVSFGLLINAQAMGDRQALLDAGRNVIRFHLKRDISGAIEKLIEAL